MSDRGSQALAKVAGAQLDKRSFNEQSSVAVTETASTAMQQRERSLVEARIVQAISRPRDVLELRDKLLKACDRRGFCETARYRKPVGSDFIEGWSVRFSEEVERDIRNLDRGATVIYDDPLKRIVRVTVTDLETNTALYTDVVVEKTIERKKAKEGSTIIRARSNSYGEPVYVLEATDDETMTKQNALISKARRNLVLNMVPADVLDDCLVRVRATFEKEDKADPAAATKRLADAFSALGIKPSDLRDLLEHDLAACNQAEIEMLRGYGASIKTGEATWNSIVEAHAAKKAAAAAGENAKGAEGKAASASGAAPTSTADLASAAKAKRSAAAAKPAAAQGELGACATCGWKGGKHEEGCPSDERPAD